MARQGAGLRHAILSIVAAAGLSPATAQKADRPMLKTTYGPVTGSREGDVRVFKGVRYAASTAGRRFQPALPPTRWTRTIAATEFGDQCPQIAGGDTHLFDSWKNERPASEDCLLLNFWTRGLGDGKKRPIMVWLHGGGYVTGSGASLGYDGVRLANRGDVVVVTINHRLNAFGYLHLAGITNDPRYADSSNVGSLDIVRALQWVHDNAAAIGGDSGNVTIFGESGGAAKVATLMAMPAAKGLFQKAIGQSGSMSLAGFSPEFGTTIASDLIATAGLDPTKIDALAAMPIADLVKVMQKSRSRGANFRPVPDGRSLPRQQFDPDATPVSRGVPLLVGTNRTETTLLIGGSDPSVFTLRWEDLPRRAAPFLAGGDASAIIAKLKATYPTESASDLFIRISTQRQYRRTAITQAERKVAGGGAPVWMYRLDWQTPVDGGKWQTPHALEIAFVFDNVAKSTSISGSGPDQQRLADLMSDAWIAFARTGNPRTEALPDWPRYDATRRATMIFDVTPKLIDDPDPVERSLFETLPVSRGQ
ncbi:carboxylesterase/lipase family protein [Sphingomonas sp. H160509]|uniref:carboxylesterase/lipase family protein n=1 Tax=Sphingomonas sp. H160509 TaxID=2955313 RepID=UPI0021E99E0D|nr:carboxylesterase/lipase family protein [Sphingomonas sp. H160509]MDD1449662.1 carboxylesterase/lipase family protein [Sphingomonas sp. H160509]